VASGRQPKRPHSTLALTGEHKSGTGMLAQSRPMRGNASRWCGLAAERFARSPQASSAARPAWWPHEGRPACAGAPIVCC